MRQRLGSVDARLADTPLPDAPLDAAARCDRGKPFGTPVKITELNSAADDHSATLTADELTVLLSEESIWQAISTAKGKSGKTLEETNAAVAAQAAETGALADIGELDTESLQGLFGIDPTDPSRFEHGAPGIDDDTAMKVFEKLQGAAPDARGPLIRQIDRMRELGELCNYQPWKYVEALHDAVADRRTGARVDTA